MGQQAREGAPGVDLRKCVVTKGSKDVGVPKSKLYIGRVSIARTRLFRARKR